MILAKAPMLIQVALLGLSEIHSWYVICRGCTLVLHILSFFSRKMCIRCSVPTHRLLDLLSCLLRLVDKVWNPLGTISFRAHLFLCLLTQGRFLCGLFFSYLFCRPSIRFCEGLFCVLSKIRFRRAKFCNIHFVFDKRKLNILLYIK